MNRESKTQHQSPCGVSHGQTEALSTIGAMYTVDLQYKGKFQMMARSLPWAMSAGDTATSVNTHPTPPRGTGWVAPKDLHTVMDIYVYGDQACSTRSDTGAAGWKGREPEVVFAKRFTLNEHQPSLSKTRELTERMEGQRAPPPHSPSTVTGEHGLGGQTAQARRYQPRDDGCLTYLLCA